MKLIQLTDIHLTAPGKTIAGRDPNANFARALGHALENHPDAEAVVITGDLSDWGERADYELLKSHAERMPIPVHLAIGNHDDRETFLDVFPDLADDDGHVQKTFVLSGGTGIIIDTWGPETHAGHYCDVRCAWLDRALTAAHEPVYLFMHHNPIPIHVTAMDEIMLLDADAFGAVVAPHRDKIKHLFFGHCHLPLAGSFHGVPVSSIRSTNHASWASFDGSRYLSGSDLPESYAVVIVDGPSVTSHMIEFGYTGEVRRGALPDYATWDKELMVR